jgi:glycosyltransferase involved in cell wall biosynthesis
MEIVEISFVMRPEGKFGVLVTTVPEAAGGGILGAHRILFQSPILLQSFNVTLWPYMSPLPYTEHIVWRIKRVAIESVRMLFFLMRHRDVRVVHINSTPDTKAVLRDALLMLFTLVLRRYTVLQLHSEIKKNLPYVVRTAWRFLIGNARFVLVLSRVDAQRLKSQHACARVKFVPNAVRSCDFTVQANKRLSFAIPAEHRLILSASRCIREKGLYELLDAIPQVLMEYPRVSFLFAGTGPELPRLRAAVKERGLAAHVRFLGHLQYEELIEVFVSSDIFVLPSYSEGLPNVILQALAAGLPIVATHVGGIPDVLLHGENGLLIPPRDAKKIAEALLALLADRSLCERMRAHNLRLAREKYDVDVVADLLRGVYMEAAQSYDRHE